MDLDISGKRVCIKGTFTGYKQPQLKAALKGMGARVSDLGKADLLIAGARADFYRQRATERGLPIVDEASLPALLANVVVPPPAAKKPAAPAGPVVASALSGKNLVIVSKLATMSKATAKRLLTQAGAKVQGKVSSTTDAVIHSRIDTNSEHSQARRQRVAEMSEEAVVAELRRVGIGTEELADADAALAKHDKAVLKKYGRAVRAARKARAGQVERWGLSLGTLLHAYLRVFAQRPDVHVRQHEASGPGEAVQVHMLHKKIPSWALALFDEIGCTRFCWIFADQTAEMSSFSEGYRGGLLRIPSIYRLEWCKRPESWDAFTYVADCRVDDLQAEASTFLRYEPDEDRTTAKLVFDDADTPAVFDDWESYLTLGARRGFAWYWPNGSREGMAFAERLYAGSLPRSTPEAEVVAGLQARGLSEREARGMVAWLGEDAVILLPKG